MEIEAKLTIPDRETLERLLGLTSLGGYELRPAGKQDLVDRYYDTPERAVQRGGFALRLRENKRKGRWRGTVKGLGGEEGAVQGAVHTREEHEVELQAGLLPAEWPDCPAREVALRLMGEAALEELFTVEQRRVKREIWGNGGNKGNRDSGDSGASGVGYKGSEGPGEAVNEEPGGRLVGEWSVDEVRWVALGTPQALGAALAGGRETVGLELEIELAETGTLDDLEALTTALAGFGLRAEGRSKYERGLALLNSPADHEASKEQRDTKGEEVEPFTGASVESVILSAAAEESAALGQVAVDEPPALPRAKSPGVRADEPMAEAGRKVLAFHFGRMVDNEAGARLGEDIEAVHDMRVATRRQRAALRLFGDYFKPKAIRPIGRALRETASRLGAVRDLDVLLDAAGAYQAGLNEPAARAFQPVLEVWGRERDADRVLLLAHLDSEDYRRFKEKYAAFLAMEGAGMAEAGEDAHAPSLVRDLLPARLWEHFGAVRAYAPALPGAPVETLHALRIAGKRLRYALEFFAEALDPSLRQAINAIVALQDHLGALNDADVTLARLHSFLQSADPRPAPETVLAVGAYMRAQEAKVRQLRRSVGRPWRAIVGARFRRVLARAVAQL